MQNTEFELFMEPQDITYVVKEELGDYYAEMTSWQQGFLCGLIKNYNPRKILEIGVSAGGTTAVIMNALTIMRSSAHLFSVDYSEHFYRDKAKKTGFVARWAQEYLQKTAYVEWKYTLLTGGGVCNYLDEVGTDIDFLILDTMHTCPGEILDFLACLPFLSPNAIVVMHDIAMQFANNRNAYATQLLLDSTSAKKIIGRDSNDRYYGYPNIGAFQITQDTNDYIENVFSALNIPWQYIPQELQLYKAWFCKYYDNELVDLFDMACMNNQDMMRRADEEQIMELVRWINVVKSIGQKRVYIYGNGKIGKRLDQILTKVGVMVLGHIISDDEIRGDKEIYLSEIELRQNDIIVVGVGKTLTPIITENLKRKGIADYVSLF